MSNREFFRVSKSNLERAYSHCLERAQGISFDDLPNEILSDKIIETINRLHSCKILFGKGSTLVVRHQAVVSITGDPRLPGK